MKCADAPVSPTFSRAQGSRKDKRCHLFFFPLVWSHCRENLNLGNSTLKEEEVMSQRRARLNQSALITAGTAAAAETLVDSKAALLEQHFDTVFLLLIIIIIRTHDVMFVFSGPLCVCVSEFLFTPSLSFSTLSGFLYASVTHRCSFKDAANKESPSRFGKVLTVSSIRRWQPEANRLKCADEYLRCTTSSRQMCCVCPVCAL